MVDCPRLHNDPGNVATTINEPAATTSNCDATFEKLRASGAEVMQEPVDQHYGVRDCAFRDPSGNIIRFSRPIQP